MTLGETLKYYRQKKGLTLRQVEEAIAVSNAYLSQLENDKIKMPSASTMYKLASLYLIDVGELLYASGIIEKTDWKPLGHLQATVSEDEEKQLLQYLQFLRSEEAKKGIIH